MSKVKVPSFGVNHMTLDAGLYLREEREDLHLRVWDLRFKAPRDHVYLSSKVLHSIEHLFAVKLREKFGRDYVSVFIYGCKTGFGFITTSSVSYNEVKWALIEVVEDVVPLFCKDEIPCLTEYECGNPRLFALRATTEALLDYRDILIEEKYLILSSL